MLLSSTRVASFWYSAWKDAGSPNWVKNEVSAESITNYQAEKSLWKNNQLISQQKLLALQSKSSE